MNPGVLIVDDEVTFLDSARRKLRMAGYTDVTTEESMNVVIGAFMPRDMDGTPIPLEKMPIARSLFGGETVRGERTTHYSGTVEVAAEKVEQYFDRLVAGKARLRPLPSGLGTLLRDRSRYRIYDAGLNRAVELAEAGPTTGPSAS